MNLIIKQWLDEHPRAKQAVWFVLLWFAGLASVVILSMPIKWLVLLMQ